MNILKNKNKEILIPFPDFFTLISIMSVSWFFLLKEIVNFPTDSEDFLSIFALAIPHYILTFIIGLLLITFFGKTNTLAKTKLDKTSFLIRFSSGVSEFILKYWLFILTWCLMQFLYFNLVVFSNNWRLAFIILSSLATTLLLMYPFYNYNLKQILYHKKYTNFPLFLVFIIIGAGVFGIVMPIICGKIEVVFFEPFSSKKDYKYEGNSTMRLNRIGYIFKPQMKAITFVTPQKQVTKDVSAEIISITKEQLDSCGSIISLSYEILGIKKSKKIQIPVILKE